MRTDEVRDSACRRRIEIAQHDDHIPGFGVNVNIAVHSRGTTAVAELRAGLNSEAVSVSVRVRGLVARSLGQEFT